MNMQGGNSSCTNGRMELNVGDSRSLLFSNSSNSNVTAHNQVPRGHGPMTLSHAHSIASCVIGNNFRDVFNGLTPLSQNAKPNEMNRQNIKSRIKNATTEENAHSSENFVINFDNVNEPSSSVSQFQENNISVATNNGGNIHSSNNNSNNHINIPLAHMNDGSEEVPSSSTTPEVQSHINFIHSYSPIISFLLFKCFYDHREGIFIFVGLLMTFTHANSVVKREIAKQGRRSLLSLTILVVNLSVCTCFIYFVFQDQKLYRSLVFIPPYSLPLSIWDLLWMVSITDFVIKFITIQIKAGMACFPDKLIPYSSRGKWYLMLECSSQLYRGLAPIQPWIYYLMEAYGSENVVGMAFSVAYVISKGSELMSKGKSFLKALWTLLQNVSLGVCPSREELEIAGAQCPICHDEYTSPKLLQCRHVFCEACITTWFDREQTCPLCRAKITDDPSWRDGATTFFTQLY